MFHARIILACVLIGEMARATDLHVAPTGTDNNPGTQAAPFATLTRARDAVREMKKTGLPAGGVTVWVHKGTYYLTDSFTLSADDSGTADRPIVYRAVPNEEVRLVGGREIPAKDFGPVTRQEVLDRIVSEARPHVLRVDLKSLGITDYGTFPEAFQEQPAIPELFFDDQRMTLARWPNDDWARIAKVIESGAAPWRNHTSDKLGTFEYEGDRPSRWTRAPAVWLEGYWCFDWRSETIKIKTIDTAKRQITLAHQHGYGLGSGNAAPRRYYAVNLLEELDSPGEYYIDRGTGELFFWPPKPIAQGRVVLSTLKSPVVRLKDTSYVTIRDLVVEVSVETCVQITGGHHNTVAACLVRNAGKDGILCDGGEKHRIVACDVHDTGKVGMQLGGGERKTLSPCGHEALNNHIWKVSRRQRTYAPHIVLYGVGVRAAHNLLHDGPHMAIGSSGNDHVIEFNEIHHVGMECDDCGAFYMGRNPSERGTVLRYNYWHDVGSALTHGSCAIYFDDGDGGQTVHGNVFYRAVGGNFGAVFVHGGHDNIVTNNIFVECKRAVGHAPWPDKLWVEWIRGDLWKQRLLQEVDITRPPYIDRYPELKGFISDPTGRPRVNRAERNLAVTCGDFSKGDWTLKDNIITDADPGFVDMGRLDFRLRDDAEIYRKCPGFEKIPFERIGLYRDELRPMLGPTSRGHGR